MFERLLSESSANQAALLEKFSGSTQDQMRVMAEAGNERHSNLEKVFSRLMMNLNTQLDTQMDSAEQRERARSQRHDAQQAAALAQQQELIGSLGQTSQQQIGAIAEAAATQQRNLEETVSKLLGSFNEQISGHGMQAEQREQSRHQRFNEQLESMAAQQQELLAGIASAIQVTQQQSRQMAEQHQQLMTRLQQATEAAATSSKHMDSSANQLGLLSANLRQTSDALGQRLEAVTQSVEAASTQTGALAAQLQGQASSLEKLQAALLEGAERFGQAASEARNGFESMKQTQQEFLAGVSHEFKALGETLRVQVEAVEKQAEEWLRSYATEVRTQTEDRMNKWNEVSLAYADQMHRNVQAVSGILDELEVR